MKKLDITIRGERHYDYDAILRPFWEADIELFERWLKTEHVAKWYKHPDHWLHEVRERKVG